MMSGDNEVAGSGPARASSIGIEKKSGQRIKAIAMLRKVCSHGQLKIYLDYPYEVMISKNFD